MDSSETSDPLSIVPSEADISTSTSASNHQVLSFRQPDYQGSEIQFSMRKQAIELRKEELEIQRLEQQLEDERERAKIERDNLLAANNLERELKKKRVEHGIRIDTFQRGTKATLGALSIACGIFLHAGGDGIGRYLIGGGAAFFGISMANISITTSKEEKSD